MSLWWYLLIDLFPLSLILVVAVQLLSHVWLFAAPRTAACRALLSSTISSSLLKFISIESLMLSNHLIFSLLLLPVISTSIRVFSSESALPIRWLEYWSFSFNISPSKEYSGLISFRIDWFDLLAVQGLSTVSSSTTVWKHQFFSTQPSLWSSPHICRRRQWHPTPVLLPKIQWVEEPGRLQSMGSRRVRHDWATSLSLFTFMHWRRKWQSTPVFLPGEPQGRGSLVGCRLWGRTELDTTEAT